MFKNKIIVFLKGGNYIKIKAAEIKSTWSNDKGYSSITFIKTNFGISLDLSEVQGYIKIPWWKTWGGY